MYLWIDTIFRFVAAKSTDDPAQFYPLSAGKNGGELTDILFDLLAGDETGVTLGVTLGPGPFTAVKNGLATSHAVVEFLKLNARLKSYGGLRSLDLLAACADTVSGYVILDARRSRFYAAPYAHGQLQSAPEDLAPEAFGGKDTHLVAWQQDAVATGRAHSLITTEVLAQQALHLLANTCELQEAKPCYIRPPDAKPQHDWRNRLLGWAP